MSDQTMGGTTGAGREYTLETLSDYGDMALDRLTGLLHRYAETGRAEDLRRLNLFDALAGVERAGSHAGAAAVQARWRAVEAAADLVFEQIGPVVGGVCRPAVGAEVRDALGRLYDEVMQSRVRYEASCLPR